MWLRNETNGAQRVSRSVSKEAKLVLRYVYSDMPLNWHQGNTFQIDHLLPVSRLSKIIESNKDPGWPMSAVGNLALLPGWINDKKNDKTPGEYLESLSEADRNSEEPFIKFGAFFALERLAIPQSDDHHEDWSRDDYVEVVEARQAVIRDKVIEVLNLTD